MNDTIKINKRDWRSTMKRYRYLFISLLLTVLTACTSEKQSNIIIEEANLSKSEKQLLGSLTDHSFVYDVELHNYEPAAVELSVDYYENGEQKEERPFLKTSLPHEELSENKFRIILAQQNINDTRQWIGSIIHSSGSSSFKTDPQKIKETTSSVYAYTNLSEPIEMEEKHLIGYIIYSNDTTHSAPNEIHSEDVLEHLTDHEEAYLLYVTFTNEE